MFNIMIFHFGIIIQFFFKPFQNQQCLISFVSNFLFFVKKTFAWFSFLVYFYSLFLKSSFLENLLKFYSKIQKLVTFLPLKKHNTKGIFNEHWWNLPMKRKPIHPNVMNIFYKGLEFLVATLERRRQRTSALNI